MNFDIEWFKREMVVINCQTEDDARQFLSYLEAHGFNGCSVSSWRTNTSHTCYRSTESGCISYSSRFFYSERGYEII